MNDKIEQLTEKVRSWLKNPTALGVERALLFAEELMQELQENLGSCQETRKIIGPLIGQVRSTINSIKNIDLVDWVSIRGGRLSIGHRPGVKCIKDIRLQGGTHILTLFSEKEGARFIEKQAKKLGICWLWFPMDSGSFPEEERIPELIALYSNMSALLEDHASIYIHCSAGKHRTGMITYGFLRYLNFSANEAKILLKKLREKTFEEVGDERLSWGDRFGNIEGV